MSRNQLFHDLKLLFILNERGPAKLLKIGIGFNEFRTAFPFFFAMRTCIHPFPPPLEKMSSFFNFYGKRIN